MKVCSSFAALSVVVVTLFTSTTKSTSDVDLNKFYSDNSISEWKAVLGGNMHYHHGVFSPEALASPSSILSDEQIDGAMAKAVSMLYQYIGHDATILDIGSGWCGPMKQLKQDINASVTGVTISESQHAYCTSQGHQVALGNAESLLSPSLTTSSSSSSVIADDKYDIALMLESLSHIEDKQALLTNLLTKANKLVIRVNTYEGHVDSKKVFGKSMNLLSSAEMQSVIEKAGWKIVHTENIRQLTQPTLRAYQQRFSESKQSSKTSSQLAVLWDLVQHQSEARRGDSEFVQDTWQLQHGLVDFVAVPTSTLLTSSSATSSSHCGNSLRDVFSESRDFLTAMVDVHALGAQPLLKGKTTAGFNALFECVVNTISTTTYDCPNAQALKRQLLLPSVKVSNMSSATPTINKNRYTVFLDSSVLGAHLQREIVNTCAPVIGVASNFEASMMATMPTESIAALGVEWPAPFSVLPATGRLYFQSNQDMAQISSWEWPLSTGVATKRTYDREQNANDCDWKSLSSAVVDAKILTSAASIFSCYNVKRGDNTQSLSKIDLKLDDATLEELLPMLKTLSVQVRKSIAPLDSNVVVHVPLVGLGRDAVTFYVSDTSQRVATSKTTESEVESTPDESLVDVCDGSPSKLIPAPKFPVPSAVKPAAFKSTVTQNVFASQLHLEKKANVGITMTLEEMLAAIDGGFTNGLPQSVSIAYKKASKSVDGPVTFADLERALDAKHTDGDAALTAIVQNVADLKGMEQLRSLKEDLQSSFNAPISMNLYMSSEQSTALPAHTDRYDVFVVQLFGAKSWEVCIPKYHGVNDADACELREIASHNPSGCSKFQSIGSTKDMACSNVDLGTGDLMYMPKGIIHRAVATSKSVHLTIGIIRKDLTWKSLFVEAITRSVEDETLSSKILEQLEKLSLSAPAGVAWQRALPLWLVDAALSGKSSRAVDMLHDHFHELANQLEQQFAVQRPIPASSSSALDWTVAADTTFDGVVSALTRIDSINTALFSIQQRARDLITMRNQVPTTHSGNTTSLSRRAGNWGGDCWSNRQEGTFVCHEYSKSDIKNRETRNPIKEGCGCDGYYGSGCDCDTKGHFSQCRVPCEQCASSCREGLRYTGCASDFDAFIAGKCVKNEAGAYCSKTTVCADGKDRCKGGACCKASVLTQNCRSCEQREIGGGSCVSWQPGFTGANANKCAPGFGPLTPGGDCPRKKENGESCTSSEQCSTGGECKGGRCCGSVASKEHNCNQCGSKGQCVDCSGIGRDPASTCSTCQPTFYALMSEENVLTRCMQEVDAGGICRAENYCSSGDCRGDRCCETAMNGDRNCLGCNNQGTCDVCVDGYSVVNNGKCKKRCLGFLYNNGEESQETVLFDHEETEYQLRWLAASPQYVDETCEDIQHEYKRTCNDGVWDYPDFKLIEEEILPVAPTHLSCTDNCITPLGFRVFVCERNITDDNGAGNGGGGIAPTSAPTIASACTRTLDASALTTGEFCDFKPMMSNGQFAARIMYEAPFVAPGGQCKATVQLEECRGKHTTNRGGKINVLKNALKVQPEQVVNVCSSSSKYVSCYENCAADCNREMEIDHAQCHPECNVASCGFQRGHCSDMLQDTLTDAQFFALEEDSADDGLEIATEICNRESVDTTQRQIIQSACWLAQSIGSGFDMYSRNKSYVYPLAWEEYGKLITGGGTVGAGGYVGLLEVYEQQVQKAEDDKDAQELRNQLMEKISLVSMDIGDISRDIKDLRADSQSFQAEVIKTVEQLSDSQQHEFREMRREMGSLWLSQQDIGGAIAMTRETLLESDRQMVYDLTSEIRSNSEDIRNAIADAREDILDGQGVIYDQVTDNAVQLRYIREQVDRIRASQLDMQQQLLDTIAAFNGAHDEVKAKQTVAQRFYQRFNPDNGLPRRKWIYKTFDINADGKVQFDELIQMFDDFDIVSQAGWAYFKTAQIKANTSTKVTVDELNSIVSSMNFDYRTYIRKQTLIGDATMADADLNGDGTIDAEEAFQVIAFRGGVSGETEALFKLWQSEGNSNAAWQPFGCRAQAHIDIVMERVAPAFSIEKTISITKKLMGLIDAIKALADLIAQTLKDCFDAVKNVAGIIGGIFTGNIGAVVGGIAGAVDNVPKCIDGIKKIIDTTKSIFTEAKLDALELIDRVKAGISLIKDFFNPPQYKTECEALLAQLGKPKMTNKLITLSIERMGGAGKELGHAVDQLQDIVKIANKTNPDDPSNSSLPENTTNLLMSPDRIENMRDVLIEMFGINGKRFDGTENKDMSYISQSMRFIESSVDHAQALNSWYTTARTSEEIGHNNAILKAYLARSDQSLRNPSDATLCKTPFKLPLRNKICIQEGNDNDTREPLSFEREFQLRKRVPMQKQREVIERLLELVYKEKRQLEFKWLETVDIELRGLKAEDFRLYQQSLHSWNQQREEQDAATQSRSSRVAYSFFKEDFPEEFVKLGQQRSFVVDNKTINAPELLELPIDAPAMSQYYGSYYTDVRVFLLPIESESEEIMSVQLMKEGNSLFFREDGDLKNAERFQHEPQVWGDIGYFTSDCLETGNTVQQADKIRYSPYGVWKLMINPEFQDIAALSKVTAIKFEFTIHNRRSTGLGVRGFPLFANDRVAPDGMKIVRVDRDSECTIYQPEVPYFPFTGSTNPTSSVANTTVDANLVVNTTDDSITIVEESSSNNAMAGGAVIGLIVGVLLLIVLIVALAVFMMRRARSKDIVVDDVAYESRHYGVENPAYGIGGIGDMLRMQIDDVYNLSQQQAAEKNNVAPPRARSNTLYNIPTADGVVYQHAQNTRTRRSTVYQVPSQEGLEKVSGAYVDINLELITLPPTPPPNSNSKAKAKAKAPEPRYPKLEANVAATNNGDGRYLKIVPQLPPPAKTKQEDIYGNQVVADYHNAVSDVNV